MTDDSTTGQGEDARFSPLPARPGKIVAIHLSLSLIHI